MPPKVKITKEDIIKKAVEVVRRDGAGSINARLIASELNCSTQPVFSNFESMDELRYAVIESANSLYNEYTTREIESGEYPIYKATGMAYIRFAKEESELFKLLFMRDRSKESPPSDAGDMKTISSIVQGVTGFGEQKAKLFHLEIWAFVHGIASMLATDYLNLDIELISEMVTDAFNGIKMQYEEKE